MSFVEGLVAGLSPLEFISKWRQENTIREQYRQQIRLDALKVLLEHGGHLSDSVLKDIISFVENGHSQELAIFVMPSPFEGDGIMSQSHNKENAEHSLPGHSLDTITVMSNSLRQRADDG